MLVLVELLSSFRSVFGFPSGLVNPSPDAPIAPLMGRHMRQGIFALNLLLKKYSF